MNLVIFDVDGTLTDTNEVDLECYFRALEDELRVPRSTETVIEDDLVSDTGFARALYRIVHGADPGNAEIENLKVRFMRYIQQSFDADPAVVREIDGATRLLRMLATDPHWCVAVATGCWLQSATFKLEKAGVFEYPVPMATCDDSARRSDIVSLATHRAMSHYKQESFERIVAVGDRPWDVFVARKLEYAFIGVGVGADADDKLTSVGATSIVKDYRDPELFMGLLRSSAVPRS